MSNIISLTIENFRSYKEKTTFTFEAVDSDARSGNYHDVELENGETIRLLNSAVIYGANAAGKSNIIIAFLALSSFIRSSKRFDAEDKILYEPYMFSSSTRESPIKFSVEFVVDKIIYNYYIAYNAKAFISEKLIRKENDVEIFSRDENGATHCNANYLPNIDNETYLKNHLALSEFSLKANSLIQSIYKELSSIVSIPMTDEYNVGDNTKEAAKLLHDEPNGVFKQKITKLITEADAGINGVTIREVEEKEFKFPVSFPDSLKSRIIKENKYEINMLHNDEDGNPQHLPMQCESAGTKTLFTVGARVIKALQEGSFLAYDEMNIALHPKLFRRLVELFHNKETNPNNAQLLITTHDTSLVEENTMRTDQIWFVEKQNRVSNIYSAIDFEGVSVDQPIESWYRAGRLGAIPNIKPFDFDGIVDNNVNE